MSEAKVKALKLRLSFVRGENKRSQCLKKPEIKLQTHKNPQTRKKLCWQSRETKHMPDSSRFKQLSLFVLPILVTNKTFDMV